MLVKEAAAIKAAQILEACWDGTFPVDPVAIAQSHGIEVDFAPLFPGISGAIIADPDSVQILVDATENYGRQMFTCAHELGHYFERRANGDDDYSFVERRSQDYDLHELYADEFAGNLLMPADDFRHFWAASPSEYLAAARYGVSPAAALKRKERLGIA